MVLVLRGFCSQCGIEDFGQFGPWSIALPKKKLPVFPTEVTPIGPWMSVALRGNQVVYLNPKGMTLPSVPARYLAAESDLLRKLGELLQGL